MINLSELQLGNYHYWIEEKEENICSLELEDFHDIYQDFDFIKELYPIPLTNKWLKEFNFKRRKVQSKYHWENKIVIMEYNDGTFYLYAADIIKDLA